jgi:hypothetical protein
LDTPSSPRTTLSVPSYARYTDESGGRKVDEGLAAAVGLFEKVIAWLQDHYSEFEFWVERDLVWTIQSHLGQVIKERSLPYSVINDYPIHPGVGRARSVDLVIRDADRPYWLRWSSSTSPRIAALTCCQQSCRWSSGGRRRGKGH